jgi:hypothetical protein
MSRRMGVPCIAGGPTPRAARSRGLSPAPLGIALAARVGHEAQLSGVVAFR